MLYKIAVLFLFILFAQTCGGPINIPIPTQSFVLSSSLDTGSPYSQTLTVTPRQLQGSGIGTYRLKFSVKNWFPAYPGYFTVELDYGTQELCEMAGWGAENDREIEVTCPNPGYLNGASLPGAISRVIAGPSQGDQPFKITFDNGDWPLVINNLTLTFAADQ